MFDVVVDAAGFPTGLLLAWGLCHPMGTLVLKSTFAAGKAFNAVPFVIDVLKVSAVGVVQKLLATTNDKIDGSSDDSVNNKEKKGT
mmetsp:Transcript_31542/g.33888  ORF Transcript_31542/g.33888 Transcript_31542/m.33888 type:complete len:86 (-) Transcript_31542:2176-2433(-)